MTTKQNIAEHFDEIVSSRSSVRSFTTRAVSKDLLEHIFSIAQGAPSNCNTQPWLTYVVSGARRDRLTQGLLAAASENRMSMDYPYDGKYDGIYRDRQYDAAQRMYEAQGIPREDKVRRMQAFTRNYEFFGAPHAIFLCMHDWCGLREAADVGMYAQTLMLTLAAHGIGSCPQTVLGMFADVVREHLELPSDQKVLFGISFGYPDDRSPMSAVRTPRETVDASVRFVD